MAMYIDKSKLNRKLRNIYLRFGFADVIKDTINKAINNSIADVVEVKHGKFIKRTPCSEPECDQCGKCPKLVFGVLPNYCPHCGAKMGENALKEREANGNPM